MPPRKRVLLVTDIPFWEQAFGSHSRIAALARGISRDHDLNILCLKDDLSSPAPAEVAGARVTVLPDLDDEQAGRAHYATAKERWPWFKPLSVRRLSAVASLCAEWRPDVVIVEYVKLGGVLEAVPEGIFTVLDSHDVMSHRMAVFAAAGRKVSIPLCARDEANALRRFDAVLAISQFDLAYMRDVLDVPRVIYAPHGVEVGSARPAPWGHADQLLFVAGMSDANLEGLRAFLRHVWPALRRRFTLRVAGNICEHRLVRETPGVVALGRVDDLAAEYAAADIVINPVFLGGGLKIKTVEAMAAGLPCVTTEEGARGLAEAAPHALSVVTDWIDYIEEILRLADDAKARAAMGSAARDYVSRGFDPDAAMRDVRLLLAAL